MSDKFLRFRFTLSKFRAYLFNRLITTGIYGHTREETFEIMLTDWYEKNRVKLKRAGITQIEAENLGYIPIRKFSDEEVQEERGSRLETQDLDSRKYDLNLVLYGMPAYLMKTVPGNSSFPEASSRQDLASRIIFEWAKHNESFLRNKFQISRKEAKQERYI